MKLKDLFAVMDEKSRVTVHYVSEKTDFAITNTVRAFNAFFDSLLEETVTSIIRGKGNTLVVEVGGAR